MRESCSCNYSLQLFWVVSVTAGALGGILIPDRVVGLEFAMTALFLVLGIEAYKARRDIPTPLAAVGCVIVGRLVTPGQMLVVSLGLFTLVVIARYLWIRRAAPREARLKGEFTMPDRHYLLAAVLLASAITWALRAVPFALLAPLRHNELIRFLGDHSPVGVMIALVGYTLRNVAWLDPAITLPILISGAITAGLQLWRSNLVLSLAGGTVVHVALATTIAGGFGG